MYHSCIFLMKRINIFNLFLEFRLSHLIEKGILSEIKEKQKQVRRLSSSFY